jgi:hypothetical protein
MNARTTVIFKIESSMKKYETCNDWRATRSVNESEVCLPTLLKHDIATAPQT